MPIWMDLLIQIIEVMMRVVITACIPYAFSLLAQKWGNDRNMKYLAMAERAIVAAVTDVNQTFVGSLKAEGKFDAEAQAQAFDMCKDRVVAALGNDAKTALLNVVGDIDVWLASEIENAVVEAKY